MRITKEKIRVYCAYLFFISMTLSKAMGMDSGDRIYFIFAIIASVFGAVAIVLNKYSKKDLLIVLLIWLTPIISFYNNHSLTMIMLAMALTIIKDIDINDVINYMGVTWIVTIMVATLGTILGLVPMQAYDDTTNIYKWFYPGHNPFHEAIALFVMYYYLLRKKFSGLEAIIFEGINIVLFKYTTSSGGFITISLCVIGFVFYNYTKKHIKLWKILSVMIIAVSYSTVLLSFIIGILYNENSSIFLRLDDIFTNRIHVMHDALRLYPITLFGNKLDGRITYVLDNAFLDLFVEYGVVIFLLFIIMYYMLFRVLYKNNRFVEIMVCSIILIYSVVEQFIRHCFLNFTLLFFGYVIWSNCRKYLSENIF